jgi:hypothetical protein
MSLLKRAGAAHGAFSLKADTGVPRKSCDFLGVGRPSPQSWWEVKLKISRLRLEMTVVYLEMTGVYLNGSSRPRPTSPHPPAPPPIGERGDQ